ncbi:hypothetical protein SmJEL517_g06001 [Synchytrium microbalum]|uniref:Uncharacterized protein n=1 Tax=Synchytrium microbalum TaxID=1806994 RepID=A0A507BSP3_9FUNG|nr:uncharacterized protein SmJEL517_g06001 [Synchytrium microbalum]TPX30448.1 hypothetical protein SmJEL517_g06001 [Synchytrium microbalum]
MYPVIRTVLREVNKQYTSRNNNPIWKNELLSQIRASSKLESAELKLAQQKLHDLAAFLKASRTHKELLLMYFPESQMSSEEHVRKTANRVGLSTDFKDL